MNEFRVFLSYSHKDIGVVERIAGILEKNGLEPLWDKHIASGYRFHDQIQTFIAHAHVFLPVITSASSKRGWVHQEIGYAMALNVPVIPVTFGELPGEMIQQLQAVFLGDDLQNAERLLTKDVFKNLIDNYSDPSFALYQCAEQSEERAIMMANYAENIIKLGEYGHVRQKGGLSSFHIPAKVITDPVWKERYGDIVKSEYHCKCQYRERTALEKHARAAGCSIIIDPSAIRNNYNKTAQLARLNTLIEFLESMEDNKVQVAINDTAELEGNITLVGDWFAAEAVMRSAARGYRQTNFTRHAPSMSSRIQLFDKEMEGLLQTAGWTSENSREKAIEALKEIVSAI